MQTYRGVADAWECDQMQHMNVRFIAERFSRADGFLFTSLGLDQIVAADPPRPEAERLIFSKEILPGEPFLIESACCHVPGSNTLWVKHALKCVASDANSAAAVTRYHVGTCPPALAAHPAVSSPGEGATIEESIEPGAVSDPQVPLSESGRIFLSPADYKDGALCRETMVRLINHAASCTGLHRGRRRPVAGQSGIGSATLETQLRRCAPSMPVTSVLVMSGMKARSAKTITVFHRIVDAVTSDLIAEAASTHVFFEIASRTAIPIPAEISPTVFWG